MVAYVFGESGDLGKALISKLTQDGHLVKALSRQDIIAMISSEFRSHDFNDLTQVYFAIGQFTPGALVKVDSELIESEIQANLVLPILLCKGILESSDSNGSIRRDFVFIGSTSSYAGFADSASYCAAKHGLVGFVKSMNDEYKESETRFWLASMGTMQGKMSRKILGQDSSTFLDPYLVASEIVQRTTAVGNLFEPEILIRRRIVK